MNSEETGGRLAGLSGIETIPVASLLPGDSPRVEGENVDHARALAEVEAVLPPIVVHRQSMRVVDGTHRLRAALMRGDEVIRVRFFDGDARDAFLVAVRENTAHGLPLSLCDRLAAAKRIVGTHTHWSDSAIAAIAGLSAKTVADIRRCVVGEHQVQVARLGRDGRVRPLDSSAGRTLAAKLLREKPDTSLRKVAKLAGISPGTVRDVRDRLGRGESVLPQALQRDRAAKEPARPVHTQASAASATSMMDTLTKDPSLKFTAQGRFLLRLLSVNTLPGEAWREIASSVPDHCTELVGKAARECAHAWAQFAEELVGKARALQGETE